jgi:aspartyl aminopeptidase
MGHEIKEEMKNPSVFYRSWNIALVSSSAIQPDIGKVYETQHLPVLNGGAFTIQNSGDELMNKSIPVPRYS